MKASLRVLRQRHADVEVVLAAGHVEHVGVGLGRGAVAAVAAGEHAAERSSVTTEGHRGAHRHRHGRRAVGLVTTTD